MNNRFYIFALEKKNEILISLFFFIYFFTWNLINYNNIEINNNSILEAIRLYKFTPYLSFFLDNIFINLEFKNLLNRLWLRRFLPKWHHTAGQQKCAPNRWFQGTNARKKGGEKNKGKPLKPDNKKGEPALPLFIP